MRLTLRLERPRAPLDEAEPLPPDDRVWEDPRQCIGALYRQEHAPLLRFVRRRVSFDRALDVVQQSFTRLAGLSTEQVRQIREPAAYLRTTASNLMNDEARSQARAPVHLPYCEEQVVLGGPDPVAAIEARDLLGRMEAAILRLAPRTREIYLAHRIDGYSYAEIARRTGLSVKTVEKHMTRALASLHRIAR